ncbi:DJ-1/PfpI/YhbO family deglycase/protease [Sediminibacillus dalangtanensis]|uniref:DJ-1/PfpI/YhbO family deglycase/protease n=1 Tax=Sediminibacillus dalangtanensis TaxID=2729421 RepID=A0ABX7VWP5_9BACI|nr:type 1 glutamine amidotransferase domain-containing protein [Sediminibacillus dalangtanensis]QTM98742.1 DJ-1/PfpI/YhbO family deglycase/protease [Sediminibacillus dalangtanensis]
MSKKIAVLVTDMVEEIELTDPAEKFKDAGHTIELIGQEAGKQITGKNGDSFTIDKGIEEVSADSFDALLVPGGFSPDLLRIDERNAAFARSFFESKKPVFAICHGPQFLIDTDQLNGLDVTGFTSIRKDLINAGANFKDEEVVVDQNLVTSRTPDDLPAFNREALKLLEG